MDENDYSEQFPETGWICPYCSVEQSEEEKALVDRVDIPAHLVFMHEWEPSKMSWEYIYNRLSSIGGV